MNSVLRTVRRVSLLICHSARSGSSSVSAARICCQRRVGTDLQHLEEQVVHGREVVVDQRLLDAGLGGDPSRRRRGIALVVHDLRGRLDQSQTRPAVIGLRLSRRRHSAAQLDRLLDRSPRCVVGIQHPNTLIDRSVSGSMRPEGATTASSRRLRVDASRMRGARAVHRHRPGGVRPRRRHRDMRRVARCGTRTSEVDAAIAACPRQAISWVRRPAGRPISERCIA